MSSKEHLSDTLIEIEPQKTVQQIQKGTNPPIVEEQKEELKKKTSNFKVFRRPTVQNFDTNKVSKDESSSSLKHSEIDLFKNVDIQSYFDDADILKEQEKLLNEKSGAIMKRLKETLKEPGSGRTSASNDEEAESKKNVERNDSDSSFTPLFQTDVPEESLEKAKARRSLTIRKSILFGQDMWQSSLNMADIVNSKVVEHYKRGIRQSDKGEYQAAVVSFTRALNLRPFEVQCYVERAEAYLHLCDFNSAYLNYKKAHALEPEDALIYNKVAFVAYLQGQCLFDQRLFADALQKFATATKMKPGNRSYNMRAIACMAALGRSKDCLALVSRLIKTEKEKNNPELFVLRARLHLKFSNTFLAFHDVQEALLIDPKLPQALQMQDDMQQKAEHFRNQAVTLALEMRFGEAISKITQAVDIYPAEPKHHIYRGSLNRRVNNYNQAIDDFLMAIDKCKHDEESESYIEAQRQLLITYNDFSVYCYKREFYDEAITLLNKAIKGEKNEIGLYLNRGDCFYKLNNFEFALADYEQALELDDTLWSCKCRCAIVYNELAIIEYQERHYENALLKFHQAIVHNPKVGQFYIHRARCYYVLQDFQQSREDVIVAMILDPHNQEIVPFLSRLFPGRSVKEVLDSALMHNTKQRISKLLDLSATASSKGSSSFSTIRRTESDSNLSTSSIKSHGKMSTNMDLLYEKKKVREDLNNMLQHRVTITVKHPKFIKSKLSLAASSSKVPIIEDSNHKPVYSWKQFT